MKAWLSSNFSKFAIVGSQVSGRCPLGYLFYKKKIRACISIQISVEQVRC